MSRGLVCALGIKHHTTRRRRRSSCIIDTDFVKFPHSDGKSFTSSKCRPSRARRYYIGGATPAPAAAANLLRAAEAVLDFFHRRVVNIRSGSSTSVESLLRLLRGLGGFLGARGGRRLEVVSSGRLVLLLSPIHLPCEKLHQRQRMLRSAPLAHFQEQPCCTDSHHHVLSCCTRGVKGSGLHGGVSRVSASGAPCPRASETPATDPELSGAYLSSLPTCGVLRGAAL